MAAATKSALKKVLKKGFVTVNGEVATSATYIRGGEEIKLSVPEDSDPATRLIFPLRVLYEDAHLAVVHKPAGILVSGNKFKTVANALEQNLERSPLPEASKPQPVHRLDYATTGCLMVGKTSTAIRALNKLFRDKQIQKTYYAVTIGEMQEKGEITAEIDGQEARSGYEVKKSVPSARFGALNLVRLEPETGRRHQLRKHLSAIGNPILGDKDYGPEHLRLYGKGMYLHAYSLSLRHPFTGKHVLLKNELPGKFRKLFPT